MCNKYLQLKKHLGTYRTRREKRTRILSLLAVDPTVAVVHFRTFQV